MSDEVAPMDMSDYSGDLDQYINSIKKDQKRKSNNLVSYASVNSTVRTTTKKQRSRTSSIVARGSNRVPQVSTRLPVNRPPSKDILPSKNAPKRRSTILESDDSQNTTFGDKYDGNTLDSFSSSQYVDGDNDDDEDDIHNADTHSNFCDSDEEDNNLVLVNDITKLGNQFKHLKLPGILSTIHDIVETSLPEKDENDTFKTPGEDIKHNDSTIQEVLTEYDYGRLKVQRVEISISYIEETESLIDTHIAMGLWHIPGSDISEEYCVEIHFPMGYFNVMESERPKSLELLRLNMSRITNVPVTIDSIKSTLVPGLQTMIVMPEVISEEQCKQTFVAYGLLEWDEMDVFVKTDDRCESMNGVECNTRRMVIEPNNFCRILKNKRDSINPVVPRGNSNSKKVSTRETLLLENVLFIKKICPVFVNGVIPQCFQKFVFTPGTITPSIMLIDINCDLLRQILPKELVKILDERE